jgi:hypothetical protein
VGALKTCIMTEHSTRSTPIARGAIPPADSDSSAAAGALTGVVWRRRLAALLVFIGLALFYTSVFGSTSKDADVVNGYLIGLDLGRGNWRLASWNLPIDTYWTQDALAYGLISRLLSDSPVIMTVIPAFVWSAVTLLCWIIIQSRAARAEAPRRRESLVSIVILLSFLAFPVFLDNPLMRIVTVGNIHVLTIVQSLLAFVLADRFLQNAGLIVWIMLVLLLAASVAGDPLAVVIAAGPVAFAACICKGPHDGRARGVVAASILAVAAAVAAVLLNQATGGFTLVHTVDARIASLERAVQNARIAVGSIMAFLGADIFDRSLPGALPELLHLPLFLLATMTTVGFAAAFIRSMLNLERPNVAFLDSVLTTAIIFSFVACVFSTTIIDIWGGRYLLPAAVFAVPLLARNASKYVASLPFALAALAGSAFAVHGYRPTLPPPVKLAMNASEIGHWLEGRGLTFGYAQYWRAGPITTATRGKVRALPLISDNGVLKPYLWNSRRDWFPPSLDGPRPFFVIADPSDGPEPQRLKDPDIDAKFGSPAETASVAGVTVKIYR